LAVETLRAKNRKFGNVSSTHIGALVAVAPRARCRAALSSSPSTLNGSLSATIEAPPARCQPSVVPVSNVPPGAVA
jgi:hypothetical protein